MSDLARQLRRYRDLYGADDPRTRAVFAARRAEVAAEELAESGGQQMLWYLSFVDTDIAAQIPLAEQRPGGPSWLGGCLVEGVGMIDAVDNARLLGCNPGGSVQGHGPYPLGAWDPSWLHRILTADEATNLPKPRTP